MGSMRGRLRRIERQADREMLSFELEDGTTARFPPSAFLECLSHEWKRGRDHRSGKPVSEAHPLVEALKKAKDRQRVMTEYSTILMLSYKEGDVNVS